MNLDFLMEGYMGWQFRKFMQKGPFRVNFSKSGAGFSVGFPGFRLGINARRRKYISIGFKNFRWYREF